MPTNKNALVRYRILDRLLSDHHHYYDIHDLTEKVNDKLDDDGFETVTQRCIEKDYELIRELWSYGKELLVLSSNGNIQEEIFKRICEMKEEYSKLQAMRPKSKYRRSLNTTKKKMFKLFMLWPKYRR